MYAWADEVLLTRLCRPKFLIICNFIAPNLLHQGNMGTMEFKLSDHAEKRLRQRKIKPEWIRAAIENPDRTENDAEDHTLAHALKAIPEKGFKILRVVYNETTEPVTIITAYFE